jgi:hypothetical protein
MEMKMVMAMASRNFLFSKPRNGKTCGEELKFVLVPTDLWVGFKPRI